jgi:hypothetical protein
MTAKKGFSSKEIQRQLGHKRYQPVWHTVAERSRSMVHKIRACMGLRDDIYTLCGRLELDEGFFSVEVPEEEKGKPKKRGSGSTSTTLSNHQNKAKVLVMVESEPDKEKPDTCAERSRSKGKGRKVGYLKMKVILDLQSKTITEQAMHRADSTGSPTTCRSVKEHISAKSCLDTDDSTSYVKLKDNVAEHHPVKVTDKKQVGKVFPWVHIAIANAKRWILANHHGIKGDFLQFYTSTGLSNRLNEFCYKFNRRYFGEATFDRWSVSTSTGSVTTCRSIAKAQR